MKLTLTQAARGINKDIIMNVVDTCPACNGSRAAPGSKAVKCQYCNGTGMETIVNGDINKLFFTFQYVSIKYELLNLKLFHIFRAFCDEVYL